MATVLALPQLTAMKRNQKGNPQLVSGVNYFHFTEMKNWLQTELTCFIKLCFIKLSYITNSSGVKLLDQTVVWWSLPPSVYVIQITFATLAIRFIRENCRFNCPGRQPLIETLNTSMRV